MSARVLAANTSWALVCHLMSRGSLMLCALLLARGLRASSFAAYSYFQLTVAMLAAYAAMGLGVAASRYFAEAASPSGDARLAGAVWALSCLLAFAAFVATMLIPDAWLRAGLGIPRPLFALGVWALVLQIVPDGAVLGLEKYKQAAGIAAAAGIVALLGALIAIALQDERVAMASLICASLTQTLGETRIVVGAVGWPRIATGLRLRWADVRRALGLAGPMFAVSLLSSSGGWIVGRIVLHDSGHREFAMFTIGLQWFALALLLPGMTSRVLLPRLVHSASEGASQGALRRILRTGVVVSVLAASAIALLGSILSPSIVRLYGENFSSYGHILGLYLLAAVASSPANAVGNALVSRNRQWRWLGLTAVWALVLVSSMVALADMGARGAGGAYIVGYTALTAGALWLARRDSLL